MFAAFHWAVIGIALFVQIGRRRTNWKYLWTIPIIYSVIAGLEALIAGSVTGAMSVFFFFYPRNATVSSRSRIADKASRAQGRRYLHRCRVVHDNLDTIHLGLGQRLRACCLIVLYFGRPVNSLVLSIWANASKYFQED